MEIDCPNCGKKNLPKKVTKPYQYLESGLSFIYLNDVYMLHCKCKTTVLLVPFLEELNNHVLKIALATLDSQDLDRIANKQLPTSDRWTYLHIQEKGYIFELNRDKYKA